MEIRTQTVAVLVSATVDELIVSQLQIRIKPTYPTASVQCHNVAMGTVSLITFLVAS